MRAAPPPAIAAAFFSASVFKPSVSSVTSIFPSEVAISHSHLSFGLPHLDPNGHSPKLTSHSLSKQPHSANLPAAESEASIATDCQAMRLPMQDFQSFPAFSLDKYSACN